jgi:sugar/nucleoside kinase (ribokinase family)
VSDPTASPARPDVFLAGQVFVDFIFTGMDELPLPGTELFSRGLGTAPGGIANLAVAMSRLGLSVSLACAYGDDLFGEYLAKTLHEQEQIDLSWSRQVPGWSTPVTVSMAHHADRSMLTYSEPTPFPIDTLVEDPPQADTCFVHVDRRPPEWVSRLRAGGTRIVADVGWDPSGLWSPDVLDSLSGVDVFLPNSAEAMAYTRTTTPHAALDTLLERTPLVAIKCGAQGAIAADRNTGEHVAVAALPVDAVDPTGAGDVFAAAFVAASTRDWPLEQRVRFANLCAGLSVRYHSGSLGSPCWHDIGEYFVSHGLDTAHEFLRPFLPEIAIIDRVRARPTPRRL